MFEEIYSQRLTFDMTRYKEYRELVSKYIKKYVISDFSSD